jgi:hypothetical protein
MKSLVVFFLINGFILTGFQGTSHAQTNPKPTSSPTPTVQKAGNGGADTQPKKEESISEGLGIVIPVAIIGIIAGLLAIVFADAAKKSS